MTACACCCTPFGGTTAVVISFVAPALFWERFVGFMYPLKHPKRAMAKGLQGFAGLVAALSREALMCCFTSVVEPCHTASKAPDAARNDCERAQVPPAPPCLVGHLYSSAVVFPSSFGLLQYIINHKLMRQRPTKEAATAMRTSNEMV